MSESQDRWSRVQEVFHEAAALPEPERTATLNRHCAGDTTLMEELRSLLAACEAEQSHTSPATTDEPRHIGPYRLERLIGTGGMGAVYLAARDDGHFEQHVAIKLIDLPLVTELGRERFRAERQILAGLTHPYIARLLDGGTTESGELYLVMEYIEGLPLTRFADEHKLSIRQRLQLFRMVSEAVQYAHAHLVVHRDLKPDNILVTAEGTPRLLDFGTAKLLTPEVPEHSTQHLTELTRAGVQAFTPRYASPEQVLGRPVTIRSDIYSLGVLLFVLLTGRHPYELADFTTEEMLRVIVHTVPPRPGAGSQPHGPIDADLDSIVAKSLRKQPEERYLTADQLTAELTAYLEGRPVLARRGKLRYRAAKFARRNLLPLAASLLLALSLLAGGAGILWQSHVANLERRKADARAQDLRQLSNSLLSELDEALKDIPGSTGAQKLLVTRVLEHLDRMAQDANGDRLTTLDLIDAYTRLGNVQSNAYFQNVGDTPGALASFQKALTLAAPLAAAYPQDSAVLRAYALALTARGQVLSTSGQARAAAESLHQAATLYDRVVTLPGVTTTLFTEASSTYEVFGNIAGEDAGLADPEAATLAYHRALALDQLALQLDPAYIAARRAVPYLHMHLGNLILDTDPATAQQEFETSQQMFALLPADERQRHSQVRFQALLVRKIAAAHRELGEYAQAEPLFAQALASYRQLFAADPTNIGALGDLYRVLTDQSSTYELAVDPILADPADPDPQTRTHNLRAAAESLAACAESVRRILQLAPTQVGWKPVLADVELRRNTIQLALGAPALPREALAGAVTELSQSAQSPTASADDIRTAVPALLLPEAGTLRNPPLALELAQHGADLTHHRAPGYLLLLATAQQATHQPSLARQTARQALALLPTQQPGRLPSRLRRQLEAQSTQ